MGPRGKICLMVNMSEVGLSVNMSTSSVKRADFSSCSPKWIPCKDASVFRNLERGSS